jgi:hypothetical protein
MARKFLRRFFQKAAAVFDVGVKNVRSDFGAAHRKYGGQPAEPEIGGSLAADIVFHDLGDGRHRRLYA